MRSGLSVLLISIFLLTGCSTVISEQSRKLVNTDASFKAIKESPENYIGKNVMLGGRIANIRNSGEGAQLEIVEFQLTSQHYPEDRSHSYGRFLATNSSYMEPLIFKSGMLITLVGEIKGEKIQRLDDMDYRYPVIALREWYLWPESGPDKGCTTYPVTSPQYNPYNYGLGSEPFLQRPYGPIYQSR